MDFTDLRIMNTGLQHKVLHIYNAFANLSESWIISSYLNHGFKAVV